VERSNIQALSIPYTPPVLRNGLTSDGRYAQSNGNLHGFTPNVLNIMAMDTACPVQRWAPRPSGH